MCIIYICVYIICDIAYVTIAKVFQLSSACKSSILQSPSLQGILQSLPVGYIIVPPYRIYYSPSLQGILQSLPVGYIIVPPCRVYFSPFLYGILQSLPVGYIIVPPCRVYCRVPPYRYKFYITSLLLHEHFNYCKITFHIVKEPCSLYID